MCLLQGRCKELFKCVRQVKIPKRTLRIKKKAVFWMVRKIRWNWASCSTFKKESGKWIKHTLKYDNGCILLLYYEYEEIIIITLQDFATVCSEFDRRRIQTQDHIRYKNKDYEREDYDDLHSILNLPSILDR